MSINVQNLIAALGDMSLTLSREQIGHCYELLNARRRLLDAQSVLSFRRGDRVTFNARGIDWTGEVKRVNQKTVTVMAKATPDSFPQEWRVSPAYLKAA